MRSSPASTSRAASSQASNTFGVTKKFVNPCAEAHIMLSNRCEHVSGIAVMRNVVPGHAASTFGTMGFSIVNDPFPSAHGLL